MTNRSILIFGEVLFDHFSDGSVVLGGAPFNVAWHLQAFKQQPDFISRVGQDQTGAHVKSAMQSWEMALSGLQQDPVHPTGTVQVTIEKDEPTYLIVPDQAYDFIATDQLPLTTSKPCLLYHGTLATRNAVSGKSLSRLKQNPNTCVFMDVNLREPWWDKNQVQALADEADWIKLNHLELQLLQANQADEKTAMQTFLQSHQLQGLVVTRGAKGVIAITANGEEAVIAPANATRVVDTVGAGDAFASVLLLGLNLDWPLQQTLERAQAFASALVGRRGATVNDPDFYCPFIDNWKL